MHFSSIFILASAASAAAALSGQGAALVARSGLSDRQTHYCQPVTAPVTCERSCGVGYVQCISFPNCYNPGLGQTCCSDGTYCPSGSYCTNAGCCPNGTPLADCGATVTLSVIPPPAQSPTAASSEGSSSAVETTSSIIQSKSSALETSTSTTEATTSTSTSTSTTSTSTSTTSTTASTSTPSPSPSSTTPAPTSTLASTTSTTASIATQTANAGQKQHGSIAGFALGGLGLAIWL